MDALVNRRLAPEYSGTRRDFLRVSIAGAVGALGSALPGVEAAAANTSSKTRGAILIVLAGGMSSWDSLDYKPDAPSVRRGPFNALTKRTGDAVFSELLPNLASDSDNYLLLRALEAADTGVHQNAYRRWLNGAGEHLATKIGKLSKGIPYVHAVGPGVDPMFRLEREEFPTADALHVEWDNVRGTCSLKNELHPDTRIEERLGLKRQLDALGLLDSEKTRELDYRYDTAHQYLTGALSNVISKPTLENRRLEGEFGLHPYGRMFLLAGNLADKAETGIVVVETGHWDHHDDLKQGMEQARELDHALAALIRRFGDRCTIAMRGEFGRSPDPQINRNAGPGRRHFEIHAGILAGPNIRNGEYGVTNSRFEITDQRVTDAEFAEVFLEAAGASEPGSAKSGLRNMLKRS